MTRSICSAYSRFTVSSGRWILLFFFFSSRRRHTRYWRDWSSDVCSSDLHHVVGGGVGSTGLKPVDRRRVRALSHVDHHHIYLLRSAAGRCIVRPMGGVPEIGRASCRERV